MYVQVQLFQERVWCKVERIRGKKFYGVIKNSSKLGNPFVREQKITFRVNNIIKTLE